MTDNGGIIGKNNSPTANTASGIWGLRQVFNAVSDSIWPGAGTAATLLSITSSSSVSTISGSGTQSDPFTTQSTIQGQHNTTAFAEFTISGPGTLYYDVRVSSESSYDFARLIVNGNTLVDISGTTSDSGNISVSNGNVVRFEYEKDGSVNNNDDTGYLDALYIA